MLLQELFASIRARLRRSTRHRDEDGTEIARRLQELLAKPTEIETLSTRLVEYDAIRRRVWILGRRCHHGATGTVVTAFASLVHSPAGRSR